MSITIPDYRPRAFAHRGGSAEAPENTSAAIEHTLSLGYTNLETDVRLTSDGVVVLQHDAFIDRTWNGTGAVGELTWSEFSRLRGPKGSQPVCLEEILENYPNLRINVDAKCPEVVQPLCDLIKKLGAQDRVCIASFSAASIRKIRSNFEGAIQTSLATTEVVALRIALSATLPPSYLGVPGPRQGVFAVQVPEFVRGLRVVTPRFIAGAHTHGLEVHVWTVNDVSVMTRLLDLGVDGIITDRPELLREVLRLRGQWKG